MRAIVFEEHGDIDVLAVRDIEAPDLEPDQVRVAVRACSLNYHDIFTRRGMPGIKVPLPVIPGCDCAGEVAEVGPRRRGLVGRRPGARGPGAPREGPDLDDRRHPAGARTPSTWSCTTASSSPSPTTSASSTPPACPSPTARRTGWSSPGAGWPAARRCSSSGRAVAWGRARACSPRWSAPRVIAAAGSADKCRRLAELGADETVDYSTTDFVAHCRERTGTLFSGGGYDVVVNFTGGDTWARSLRCVKAGRPAADVRGHRRLRPAHRPPLHLDGRDGHPGLQRLDPPGPARPARPGPHRGASSPSSTPPCRSRTASRPTAMMEERRFFGKIVITADAPV